MKKYLFIVTAFSFFIQLSMAQGLTVVDSVSVSPEQQLEHLFEYLDTSLCQSDILFDKGFAAIDLVQFDGSITSGAYTNFNTFGLAYMSLFSGQLNNSSTLPPIDLAYTNATKALRASDTIPLAFSKCA